MAPGGGNQNGVPGHPDRVGNERTLQVTVEPGGAELTRLDALYRRHAGDGLRLAYLITGDRALAEDLLQDAFLRLAPRLIYLRDPGALEAYLRRTIVNLANAHFRHAKVERRYVERETARPSGVESGPDLSERDSLWAALRELPLRTRTAIVLRYYEDLSDAQTAEIMRCRPGTVKSLVSRGMERLRPLMAGE